MFFRFQVGFRCEKMSCDGMKFQEYKEEATSANAIYMRYQPGRSKNAKPKTTSSKCLNCKGPLASLGVQWVEKVPQKNE